jgi:hypothetical protein
MRNKPYRKGDRLIEFVRDVMDRGFIVLEVCSGVHDVLRDLGGEVLKIFQRGKMVSAFWGHSAKNRNSPERVYRGRFPIFGIGISLGDRQSTFLLAEQRGCGAVEIYRDFPS